jgi:U3 small nucleolar RNA-associated protein 15
MAAEVQLLQPLKLPKGPSNLTSEQKYWNSFASELRLDPSQHSSPVTHISIPPPPPSNALSAPQDLFAVTTGSRVQIFSSKTRKVVKTISRFGVDDIAHSGNIRRDGRILVAGGDSGAIQAFDVKSRAILKTWKEHKQPVWVTQWHPSELTSLMSCSDDRTVRLWDLPSDKSVTTFDGHQDYVRTGTFMPAQSGLLVSGSYDQTVRLWDSRAGGKAVMTFKHAAPIETVLPMPSGTAVLASSDNTISVLDIVAAKPIHMLRNHQKTVTALSLANNGERLLSGALDGHVKVFETSGWNVVGGLKYPSPILSLSVIPSQKEDKHIAVGMQSGLLSIKTHLSGEQKVQAREREKEMKALMDGRIDEYDQSKKRKRGKGWEKRVRGKDFTGESADIVMEGNVRGKMKAGTPWAQALRWGEYAKSLDLVLEFTVRYIDAATFCTKLTMTPGQQRSRTISRSHHGAAPPVGAPDGAPQPRRSHAPAGAALARQEHLRLPRHAADDGRRARRARPVRRPAGPQRGNRLAGRRAHEARARHRRGQPDCVERAGHGRHAVC